MGVKRLQSAERVLAALEALAEHQPVGVAALARLLGEDKSAVQRALVTLSAAGWIRPAAGDTVRWELTTRALVVAGYARATSELTRRARATLEALRDETGETIILVVADQGRVVVVDMAESRELVRTAPNVGMVIPTDTSAGGKAILAAMGDRAVELLGAQPSPDLRADLAEIRRRGWALNEAQAGATSVGAAVFDAGGAVVGAIAISAPAGRMPAATRRRLGARVAAVAATLR